MELKIRVMTVERYNVLDSRIARTAYPQDLRLKYYDIIKLPTGGEMH
jgi:hypothetical protein